jgi:hypothetical protein
MAPRAAVDGGGTHPAVASWADPHGIPYRLRHRQRTAGNSPRCALARSSAARRPRSRAASRSENQFRLCLPFQPSPPEMGQDDVG